MALGFSLRVWDWVGGGSCLGFYITCWYVFRCFMALRLDCDIRSKTAHKKKFKLVKPLSITARNTC